MSLVQRSAAYLEILTVEEALPRDKPRRFGAEDVSTWEESCHEVWAVKPPVFREVKRYVGDFEAFSTLTSSCGKPTEAEFRGGRGGSSRRCAPRQSLSANFKLT